MLGRTVPPRIRRLHEQRIYRISSRKDYRALLPLVIRSDRSIHMDRIVDQRDRLGHFCASFASAHTTASTAMKRLSGETSKSHVSMKRTKTH